MRMKKILENLGKIKGIVNGLGINSDVFVMENMKNIEGSNICIFDLTHEFIDMKLKCVFNALSDQCMILMANSDTVKIDDGSLVNLDELIEFNDGEIMLNDESLMNIKYKEIDKNSTLIMVS